MASSSDQQGPGPTSPKRRNPAAHLAAHQFKPGQSGNPAGRPRGRSITAVLRERLDAAIAGEGDARAAVDRIAEAVLKLAIAGDLKALALLLERTEGPPPKGDEPARGEPSATRSSSISLITPEMSPERKAPVRRALNPLKIDKFIVRAYFYRDR